ncbi:MAG: glycerophosphodiester phosphodiesterase [Clostridia bacterium]|nr:glycerophosphodiester phosphodiesterase [Clostridia bacterium]
MKNFDWLIKTPIAHRGLHNDKLPENSISAFQNAIRHGYNIETDVRLTKDKKLVLFHDDTLSRMCGENVAVADLTFDELQSYTLKNTSEKVPLLSDLLSLAGENVGLLIELKSDGKGELEKAVYDEIKNLNGRYAVQSFHPYSVKWFKDNAKEIPRGLLATIELPPALSKIVRFVLKHLLLYKKVSPDFLAYDERFIAKRRVQKRKVPRLAWTVREKTREHELLEKGLADNVIFENYLA